MSAETEAFLAFAAGLGGPNRERLMASPAAEDVSSGGMIPETLSAGDSTSASPQE